MAEGKWKAGTGLINVRLYGCEGGLWHQRDDCESCTKDRKEEPWCMCRLSFVMPFLLVCGFF